MVCHPCLHVRGQFRGMRVRRAAVFSTSTNFIKVLLLNLVSTGCLSLSLFLQSSFQRHSFVSSTDSDIYGHPRTHGQHVAYNVITYARYRYVGKELFILDKAADNTNSLSTGTSVLTRTTSFSSPKYSTYTSRPAKTSNDVQSIHKTWT